MPGHFILIGLGWVLAGVMIGVTLGNIGAGIAIGAAMFGVWMALADNDITSGDEHQN